MFKFEVFIQSENRQVNWESFINALLKYDKKVTLEINFLDNNLSFYVYSEKDFSNLASSINPFMLKLESVLEGLDKSSGVKYIIKLPRAKNLFEIKEQEQTQKGNILKKTVWYINSFANIHSCTIDFYFEDEFKRSYINRRFYLRIPFYLIEQIEWDKIIKYQKKKTPLYLKLENVIKLFDKQSPSNLLEIDGFPYLTDKNYLSLKNFDFDRHSLIVGQTGTGKSKLISLFINRIDKLGLNDKYTVIVIDPHAALFTDINNIRNSINIDFINNACYLFNKNSEPKIATELTILLFKTLLKDQFNGKLEQVLKYSLFSLFSTKEMSLTNLKDFVVDIKYRKTILKNFSDDNISKYFDTEFNEIETKYYEVAIAPIITIIDDLNFIPAFTSENNYDLSKEIKNKFLITFSLSKIFLGEKTTKLIAGLLIQQIFLIAQSKKVNKKIILIIDETSTIQNDALITILSEARKFDLSVFLSIQYLKQMDAELLKAILSNIYNYFVFKTTEEDSKLLGNVLSLNIPEEILKSSKNGEEEIRTKIILSLNIRECLVRCFSNNKFYPAFRAKTLEI